MDEVLSRYANIVIACTELSILNIAGAHFDLARLQIAGDRPPASLSALWRTLRLSPEDFDVLITLTAHALQHEFHWYPRWYVWQRADKLAAIRTGASCLLRSADRKPLTCCHGGNH